MKIEIGYLEMRVTGHPDVKNVSDRKSHCASYFQNKTRAEGIWEFSHWTSLQDICVSLAESGWEPAMKNPDEVNTYIFKRVTKG